MALTDRDLILRSPLTEDSLRRIQQALPPLTESQKERLIQLACWGYSEKNLIQALKAQA